jgi:DNA-directed RNA polymerase specialized sigma24 family protein
MAHDTPKLPDEFKNLLRWLAPDSDAAVEKYLAIRSGLIKMFEVRGAGEPEALADDTIDRVLQKLDSIADTYEGDPAAYFYGVAKFVFLEDTRRPRTEPLPDHHPATVQQFDDKTEAGLACLDKCIAALSAIDRRMVAEYYAYDEGEKISWRKRLASELGMSTGLLRTKVFRLREKLRICVVECLAC